jgi:hypothetical protein
VHQDDGHNADAVHGRGGEGGKGRRGARKEEYHNHHLIQMLDVLHLEACQEVSVELKQRLAALEARVAAYKQGLAAFPKGCFFLDLLPQGHSAEDKIVRLEEECAVLEVLLLTTNPRPYTPLPTPHPTPDTDQP